MIALDGQLLWEFAETASTLNAAMAPTRRLWLALAHSRLLLLPHALPPAAAVPCCGMLHRRHFHITTTSNSVPNSQPKRARTQLIAPLFIAVSSPSTPALLASATTTPLWLYNREFRIDSACQCNRITTLPTLTSSTAPSAPSSPTTSHLIPMTTEQALVVDHGVCQTQLRKSHQFERRPIAGRHMSKSIYKEPVLDAPAGLFRGELDRYCGITVESKAEFDETVDFPDKLKKSLAYWQENGRRAIWFIIANEHSAWIPHLTQNDFIFHHVRDDMVALYRWLPQSSSNVPQYCHTMVGVGGLVVNDNDEVLVVSDRFALIPNSWKLPGGYVDPGEDFVEAAIREVREETNIESTFRTLLGIRHAHGTNFGCSDLYIVVALKPTTLEIKKCEREIAKAAWMPIKEYLENKDVHQTNRQFVHLYLNYRKRGLLFTCERARHQVLDKEYNMYYIAADKEENI